MFALSAVTPYDCGGLGIVTKPVTTSNHLVTDERNDTGEAFEEFAGRGGGAERVRTAASQCCSTNDDSTTTDDLVRQTMTPQE